MATTMSDIEAEIEKLLPCNKPGPDSTHWGPAKVNGEVSIQHAKWARDCPAYYRPAVAEFCRKLAENSLFPLAKAEWDKQAAKIVELEQQLANRTAEKQFFMKLWQDRETSVDKAITEKWQIKSQLAAERASREKAVQEALEDAAQKVISRLLYRRPEEIPVLVDSIRALAESERKGGK